MKKILLTVSLSALTALIMSGCDASSEGTSMTSVSGNVADGYIKGATVFLDLNKNEKPDNGEPLTTTGEHGAYMLANMPTELYKKGNIVVNVPADAIDEDTNQQVGAAYTMISVKGGTFISPITTMVYREMVKNNKDLTDASTTIKDSLGIKGNPLSDYVKDDDNVTHNKARVIAQLKADVRKKIESQVGDDINSDVLNTLTDREIMYQMGNINMNVDDNSQLDDMELKSIADTIAGNIIISNLQEKIDALKKELDEKRNDNLLYQRQENNYGNSYDDNNSDSDNYGSSSLSASEFKAQRDKIMLQYINKYYNLDLNEKARIVPDTPQFLQKATTDKKGELIFSEKNIYFFPISTLYDDYTLYKLAVSVDGKPLQSKYMRGVLVKAVSSVVCSVSGGELTCSANSDNSSFVFSSKSYKTVEKNGHTYIPNISVLASCTINGGKDYSISETPKANLIIK